MSWFDEARASVRIGFFSLLVLPVLLLGVPSGGYVSAQSLLARPARLTLPDVRLEEAIRALQRSSGVSMAFSTDLLPEDHRVGCQCDTVSVGEALDSLLAGTGLHYEEGRRQILIGRQGGNGTAVASPYPTVEGRVVEAGSSFPVAGASVALLPGPESSLSQGKPEAVPFSSPETLTGTDGRFSLSSVPPGEYRLRARAPGFLISDLTVWVGDGEMEGLRLDLFRVPYPLEAIVISPGSFGLLEETPGAMGTRVSRDEIESIPQFGDDAFRALKTMPGVASGDIATQLHVRGSTGRDLLVRLDGLELYEPFHLKDLDGVFGIVDIQALGQIDLITGGFGVEQGDRSGGIFDMRTRSPPDTGTRTTVAMSLSSMSGTSQGTFAEGRGEWIAAARWGFLDIVMGLTGYGDDLSPDYWDVLGKALYRLSDDHFVALNVLLAGDGVGWLDDEVGSDLQSAWANRYLWGSWKASFLPGLRATTILAVGGLSRDRGGRIWSPEGDDLTPQSASISDKANFSFRQIRQEWQVDLSDDLLLKTGFDFKDGDGAYDYWGRATHLDVDDQGQVVGVPESTEVDLDVRGREVGLWGGVRGRMWDALTWEAGVRFDHQTHTGDSDLAPRLLVRWDAGHDLILKGSWGRYFQSQGIQELSSPDGEVTFSPSEMAEQAAVGVEGRFPGGIMGRVEGYFRSMASPRPQFLNLSRQMNPFLEVQSDRVRIDPSEGKARGLEFLLARDGAGDFSWSAGYALAETKQKVDGRWAPRVLDQRHTLNFHSAYRLGEKWRFSGAFHFHTGWPVTKQIPYREFVTVDGVAVASIIRRDFGPLNGERLPDYKRLDLRVTRSFELSRSRVELYLDVFNVTNEPNFRAYEYQPDSDYWGGANVVRWPDEDLLPILPTLGFRWVF